MQVVDDFLEAAEELLTELANDDSEVRTGELRKVANVISDITDALNYIL